MRAASSHNGNLFSSKLWKKNTVLLFVYWIIRNTAAIYLSSMDVVQLLDKRGESWSVPGLTVPRLEHDLHEAGLQHLALLALPPVLHALGPVL